MFRRAMMISLTASALCGAGLAADAIECPVVGAAGVQTASGDVFVAGQFAVGVAGGGAELGQGAIECWFDASAAGCAEDIDGNGMVDLSDLSIVLSTFGQSGAGLPADINGDGNVDLSDLGMILAVFGISC